MGTIEVFRDRNEKGYVIIEFSFASSKWDTIVNISKLHGWTPSGTKKPDEKDFHHFTPDYSGTYPYHKIVDELDALTWSNSLKRFINENKNFRDDQLIQISIEDNYGQAKPSFKKDKLIRLAEFMSKGEFYFWFSESLSDLDSY